MKITYWVKDARAIRDNLKSALEMVEKLPEGLWRESIKRYLVTAAKHVAKGVAHGQDNPGGEPEPARVDKKG